MHAEIGRPTYMYLHAYMGVREGEQEVSFSPRFWEYFTNVLTILVFNNKWH